MRLQKIQCAYQCKLIGRNAPDDEMMRMVPFFIPSDRGGGNLSDGLRQ
jgi:hypothetical protein